MSALSQQVVVIPVHGPVERRQGVTFVPGDCLEKGRKLVIYRDGEVLPGIGFLSLGIDQGDRSAPEIDLAARDSRLAEPAPEVELQLEGRRHPCLSPGKRIPDGCDLGGLEFPFLFGGADREACQGKPIGLGISPADGLVHKEAQEFDLMAGRVPSGVFSCGAGAPVHVVLGVSVSDFAGVSESALMEPDMDGAPEIKTPLSSVGMGVMLGNVIFGPIREVFPPTWPHDNLLARATCGLLEGLCRILGRIPAELEILFFPAARIDVSEANKPIWGPCVFGQICHANTSST